REPDGEPGTDADGNRMGVHDISRRQLASADMDFPHARQPDLWPERRWASAGQRANTCVQQCASVSIPQTGDWCEVAKRYCRGPLRPASAARGVCRVGCRAKRYFGDFLRLSQFGGLRPVCGDAFLEALRFGGGCVSLGSHGEADPCDLAFCYAVTRLLATVPVSLAAEDWDRGICQSAGAARSREAAAILSRRGFGGHYCHRTITRRSCPHVCSGAGFATSV